MATYLPTYGYLPTYLWLPTNISKPTVIYLPIPKYQYIITADPGAGIGLALLIIVNRYTYPSLQIVIFWQPAMDGIPAIIGIPAMDGIADIIGIPAMTGITAMDGFPDFDDFSTMDGSPAVAVPVVDLVIFFRLGPIL